MQIPKELADAVERELSGCGTAALAAAVARLSDRYRAQQPDRGSYVPDGIDFLAYLAVRLPGTYAAAYTVLSELQRRQPAGGYGSMLDMGAGPGTAGWAATAVFNGLQRITALEREDTFIRIGRSLAGNCGSDALRQAVWTRGDLAAAGVISPHDLVVCSYTLGELPVERARIAALAAWEAAGSALVIIEPGTMAGFGLIRTLRNALPGAGVHLAAPCPHRNACPLPADDWCHFAARVSRSALHRRLKGGTLEYEDEKFSYLIALKEPAVHADARILRHPQRFAGHTRLQLCTTEGLAEVTVTRSNKPAWKRVRKAGWGDAWE